MPELPEVEYTARQLRGAIVGATISEALVFWERTIDHPDVPNFLAEIADRRILDVRRRGKFLIIDLDGEVLLTIHRRMTGNLLLLPPGWEIDTNLKTTDPVAWSIKGPSFRPWNTEDTTNGAATDLFYCRVCFNLFDGRRLLFIDTRKFGRIGLWPSEREQEALEGLGLEPFSDEFTVEALAKALAGRKGAIKQVLLDQGVIAGLGNIYADEALYYAAIHPLRHANSLTPDEIQRLYGCITSRESLATAAARLSSVLYWVSAVRIFVQHAKNSHRREESGGTIHQRTSRKDLEYYVNRRWNFSWLTTLER